MILIFGHHRAMFCRPPTAARWRAALIGALVLPVALVGCGSSSPGTGAPGDPLRVVASFYPLQWMAQQVGGKHVQVASLTKPGAEPHDLELSPRDVGAVQDAAVVAYLSGFQPAVDTAVADAGDGQVFDARRAANLDLEGEGGSADPHFWLDPTRMGAVANAFATTLADADPTHATEYRRNAARLRLKLATLDLDFHQGLADCARTEVVTSHTAFAYLTRRYGLEQVGVTGLTPEAEPSPQDLAKVADFVDAHDVTTIYFETLTSPAVAKAVASETGATTAVLDPIEGLNDRSKGRDYLQIMRSNLRTLRTGQGCS